MTRAHYLGLGLLLGIVVAIAVVWGWKAVVVFAFFALVAGGVAFGAGVGGEWIRDVSGRRFDDRDRR